MKNLIDEFRLAVQRGFVHIFSAQALNKIVRFVSSVVVIRLLTKGTYGNFSYAQNILQLFLLANGLGVLPAILQFCSEKEKSSEKLPYLKYGLKIGMVFNTLIAMSIVIFVNLFHLPLSGSENILFLLCLMPVVILLFEIMGVYLRADFKNKEFSLINISNTVLYLLGTIIGGYIFGVKGIIFGRYMAFILVIAFGLRFFHSEIGSLRRIHDPNRKDKKEFLKYSIVVSLTNSIGQTLYLLDVFLVGMIIKDESVVASYKTATIIPFALTFIPLSVMTFAYPYFAKNAKNKQKLKTYFYKIQKYLVLLNLVISFVLILFAPLIIKTLFGPEYTDSILPFRILSLGFFISGSFRIVPGNVIASIRKVKINLVNSILCGIVNIVLDIILIHKFGSVGAAIATTSVFFISAIAANVYLFCYFKD